MAPRMDWPLLTSALTLLLFGLMSLYSVGLENAAAAGAFKKQILFVGIGLVPFAIFFGISPDRWRKGANWLYVANLGILVFVLVHGHSVNGSDRWIQLPGGMRLQPSELAKIFTILTLSAYYANRQDSIHKVSTFVMGFLHVLVPAILIWKQPHLGATLVILVMWFGVSMIAGVPAKTLGTFMLTVTVLLGVGLSVPSIRAKILPDYQGNRGKELIDSMSGKKDVKKGNYQTERAKIAIGVGGLSGAGFGHGEQKAAGFIPEQQNDFIVTVIGEEGGLVGVTLLLIAYGTFFYRIFLVMLNATEPFYRMAAAGVFAVLGFHTFVNMAMVLQLLPVVGLWLPFLSSGGTAIWLCMSCVGLLLSIRRKQRPLLF
jgi:rod shape determining protein RodA